MKRSAIDDTKLSEYVEAQMLETGKRPTYAHLAEYFGVTQGVISSAIARLRANGQGYWGRYYERRLVDNEAVLEDEPALPPTSDAPLRSITCGPAGDDDIAVELVIPGNPGTKGRPRVVRHGDRVRTYSPSAKEEEAIGWYVRHAWRKQPDPDSTFGVLVDFHMPGFRRQDIDNSAKLILDACTGIVWHDDQQVGELAARIFRGSASPRTQLTVYRCSNSGEDRPKRSCAYCGNEFRIYKSTASAARYCSSRCSREAKKFTSVSVDMCAWCHGDFVRPQTPTGRRSRTPFCGIPCQKASHAAKKNRRVQLRCVECGIEYTKPRSLCGPGRNYCSVDCRNLYWLKHRKQAAKGVCEACGGFTSKKQYVRCIGCCRAKGGPGKYFKAVAHGDG